MNHWISRLTLNLEMQCDCSTESDKQTKGIKNSEEDIFIYKHLNNAQVTLQRSGKMGNSSPSVSDAGPTGYPPAKKRERNWIPT